MHPLCRKPETPLPRTSLSPNKHNNFRHSAVQRASTAPRPFDRSLNRRVERLAQRSVLRAPESTHLARKPCTPRALPPTNKCKLELKFNGTANTTHAVWRDELRASPRLALYADRNGPTTPARKCCLDLATSLHFGARAVLQALGRSARARKGVASLAGDGLERVPLPMAWRWQPRGRTHFARAGGILPRGFTTSDAVADAGGAVATRARSQERAKHEPGLDRPEHLRHRASATPIPPQRLRQRRCRHTGLQRRGSGPIVTSPQMRGHSSRIATEASLTSNTCWRLQCVR